MKSIILLGTEIGDNTIIKSFFGVKGEVHANVIVAGNPAKVIKSTTDYVNLHMELKKLYCEVNNLIIDRSFILKKTARNSIIYMIGMIIIAVVSFFNTIILTRILPNQAYAQYGLLTTFTTASITIISLGMDAAYTRFFYESGYSPLKYLIKCCKIPLLVLVVYIIVLLEPKHYLLNYVFEDGVTLGFILLFIVYLLFQLFGKFTQLTARMGEFAVNYVVSNFVGKAGFVVIIFVICYFIKDVSIGWVTFSLAFASVGAVLINIATLKKAKKIEHSSNRGITTKEMIKYGVPIMINNVMMLIVPLIERFIVRDIAGWTILSIYTAASVFYTVIAIMKNTIDNIWNPIVFQYYENEKIFKPLLHDFGLLVTWITVIGLALSILLRRWLILILDQSYFEVYLIAPAIIYTSCYEIYTMIYAVGINTSKKTIHMILAPIIRFVISVSLCYLLIPQLGLTGIGVASLFSVIMSNAYKILVGLHYYGTNQKEWKITLLWLICIVVSIFVMYSTTLLSDICICIGLCAISFIIMNKEGIVLVKKMSKLLLSKKLMRGNKL